jgi:hypothetical protein
VLSLAERVPVVDPTPASPRLIAGLSSSASAGPIGCTSGRDALKFALEPDVFDVGDLPGFLGGFFAMLRIWDESGGEKRAKRSHGWCHVALSAGGSTVQTRRHYEPSGRANAPARHCERSEAIHLAVERKYGLLRRFAPLRKRFAFSQAMTK